MNRDTTLPSHLPMPPDHQNRELILTQLYRNMLVEAAAGTGKTTSMVGRMIALLRTGACRNIRTLAAVTFTRKAAAELRGRFQVKVEKAVREVEGSGKRNLERALANIEQCFIGTIHSFCGRMLRERPVEAGVDPAFQEMDEEADARLRREAWSEYVAGLMAKDEEGILPELDRLGLRIATLEEAFVRFSDYPDVDRWPVPLKGSISLDLKPAIREVLAYVDHMRQLAPRLPSEWGNDPVIPRYLRLPRVVSHYDDLNDPTQLMEVIGLFDKSGKVVQREWMRDGAFTKEEALKEQSRWNEFRAGVAAPMLKAWRELRYEPVMHVMSRAAGCYDRLRQERGLLNYQDLLMKSADLLRGNPHVREYFSERFTHLLVDEFQDTDPIQAEAILLLTSSDPAETDWRKVEPRPGSLFVVGDPKQSIYRFRRADIVTYNDVKRIIGRAGGKGLVVQLSANFRTTESIVRWVNEVFQPDASAPEKSSEAMLRFGNTDSPESPSYVAIEPGRSDGNAGTLSGIYSLTIPKQFDKMEQAIEYEADRIARTIRHALDDPEVNVSRTQREIEDGKSPRVDSSDFMIVTLTRKWLSTYAGKLKAYGIPHQVTGGSALNEVRELKTLYSALWAVLRPDDPVALVAVLRSELFGVSDAQLYEFKKCGGTFSFNSGVPEGLADATGPVFQDAFSRLKSYSRWLSQQPPVAAMERIAEDLGLMASAGSGPGGEVDAGSLSKAFEILRNIWKESWTTAQLVERLGGLLNLEQAYDGISVRPMESPVVRIMNLHKVKGLEAPVVFLANPSGQWEHDVELHVDRSGARITGYMALYGDSSGWAKSLLAHPPGWDELSAKESRFLAAESLRLRYVAATRAGSALIITRRDGGKGGNPWKPLAKHVSEDAELYDPGKQSEPSRETVEITVESPAEARESLVQRNATAGRPTYDTRRAKEVALSAGIEGPVIQPDRDIEEPGRPQPGLPADGEYGVEWGTVIHLLLQVVMDNPGADLTASARAALVENELDVELDRLAVETVRSVTQSTIWKRALESERRLTEVPFQILAEERETISEKIPTILRGAIDLIFKERDGWVLVDYKTDRVKRDEVPALFGKYYPQLRLYADAWEKCTGEAVKEMGLYSVRLGEYLPVLEKRLDVPIPYRIME